MQMFQKWKKFYEEVVAYSRLHKCIYRHEMSVMNIVRFWLIPLLAWNACDEYISLLADSSSCVVCVQYSPICPRGFCILVRALAWSLHSWIDLTMGYLSFLHTNPLFIRWMEPIYVRSSANKKLHMCYIMELVR